MNIYIFSWYMSLLYIYVYILYIWNIYKENICNVYIYIQSILVFDDMQVLHWPVLELIQFCSFDRRCKTCLDTKLVLIPLQNWLCACSKTGFVPAPKPALCCVRLQNLPWYKTCLVSRQVLHLLSKLQNWICSKTGQYKTCLVSNTKDWLCI